MYASSGSFHPAAMSYSSVSVASVAHRRQRSADDVADRAEGGAEAPLPRSRRRSAIQSVAGDVGDVDGGSSGGTYSWIACHQLILAALQGVRLSADERTKVANSISDMLANHKSLVTDFVKNEIIPHAMENNACKALACSKKELSRPATSDSIDRMSQLWDQFYTSILPNIQSMLYPLENFENNFNCRKFVLTAFRDRALIPVMKSWKSADSRLHQMLLVVSIGTAADKSFLSICANCLPGLSCFARSASQESSEAAESNESQSTTMAHPKQTTRMNSSDRLFVKNDERTRPKSVQWEDMPTAALPKTRRSAKDLAMHKAQLRNSLSFGETTISYEV